MAKFTRNSSGQKVYSSKKSSTSSSSSKTNSGSSQTTLSNADVKALGALTGKNLSDSSINEARNRANSSGISNANDPIDASKMTNVTAVNPPEAPKVDPANGVVVAGNIAVGLNPDGTTKVTEGNTAVANPVQAQLDNYLKAMSETPSAEDIYNSMPEKRAFENAAREEQKYASQINTIVAKSQADQLSTIGQGRGIPEAIIGGQQAQIAREAAIQALPLQALLANAQGNKELAQQQLDTMFKMKMQDAQAQYDYKVKYLGMVYEIADKNEQRKLNEIYRKEDQAFELKKGDIAFERDKYMQQLGFSNQLALRQMDISTEANKEAIKIAQAEQAGSQEALSGYSLVNNLLNSGQVNNVVGINKLNPFNYIPGTQVQYAKNQFNQIKASLSLENREKLKGQGAVSDFEGRILSQAASALGSNISNTDADRELKQVRGAFANAAGMAAPIKITDPTTGRSVVVSGTRETVNKALMDGALVEYY